MTSTLSDATEILTPPWEPPHLFVFVPPVPYEEFATAWKATTEMAQPHYTPCGVFDTNDNSAHALLSHDLDPTVVRSRVSTMGFNALYLPRGDNRRATAYVLQLLDVFYKQQAVDSGWTTRADS